MKNKEHPTTKTLLLAMLAMIVLCFCGCKKNVGDIVASLQGTKIVFDWKKQIVYTDSLGSENYKIAPIKIVTYINPEWCYTCTRNLFSVVSKFMNNIGSDSVDYMCIVHPYSIDSIQSIMKGLDLSRVSIVLDVDNKYKERNSIDKLNGAFTTFLLDSNDRIVLVGDPFHKTEIKLLYEETIKELIKSDGLLEKMPSYKHRTPPQKNN